MIHSKLSGGEWEADYLCFYCMATSTLNLIHAYTKYLTCTCTKCLPYLLTVKLWACFVHSSWYEIWIWWQDFVRSCLSRRHPLSSELAKLIQYDGNTFLQIEYAESSRDILVTPILKKLTSHHRLSLFDSVLRIHDILVWIRIQIRGSVPLTDRSGSGFGSGFGSGCGSLYFHHWPSRCQQKRNFVKKVFLHITFWMYFYIIFQR